MKTQKSPAHQQHLIETLLSWVRPDGGWVKSPSRRIQRPFARDTPKGASDKVQDLKTLPAKR